MRAVERHLLVSAAGAVQALAYLAFERFAKALAERAGEGRDRLFCAGFSYGMVRRHRMQQTHLAGRRTEHEPRVADLDQRDAFLTAKRCTTDRLYKPTALRRLKAETPREPRKTEHDTDHDDETDDSLQNRTHTQRRHRSARTDTGGDLRGVVHRVDIGGLS